MRIRTYFVNSFVVHAVFLIYLFSLPLQRTIIQSGSYNAYFVSLQSEGKKTSNMSSARGTKKPEVHSKVKDKETRPETREPVASKVNESPEEATPVEKPDDKAREQVEEKPAQVAEVKEPEEFQQVTEAQQKEAPALVEKKQETPKSEVPETKKNETTIAIKEAAPMPPSPDFSKVDKTSFIEKQGITILPYEEKPSEKSMDVAKLAMDKETEKRLEPEKKEALQEKVIPRTEVKEKTAMPQKIEEPLNEIPEGEKPDIKESERIEAAQNTQANVSEAGKSPLIDKPSTQGRVSSPEFQKTTGSRESEKNSKAESLSQRSKIVRSASEEGLSATTVKGKPKIGKGISLRAGSDKNRVPSPQGLKDAALFGEVQGEPTVQGSATEQIKQSSQEGYSPGQDEGKQQPRTQAKQESQGNTVAGGKEFLVGIPVSEALIPCDLKIEVALRKPSAFHSEPVIQKAPVTAATTEQKNMPKATEITQISLEEVSDRIKVQITGNGSMRPKVFTLDKNRIVIDIPNVVMNSQLPSNLAAPLKDMRSGKYKDKSRLVLELNEKMPFDVSSAGDTFIVSVQKPGIKPHPIPGEQEAQEKIEAKELKETEISNITMHLLKNPHPKSDQREKQNEVTLLEGIREAQSGDKSTVKRAFSVLRTAEGAYTFVVRNEEKEPYETDLVFLIFQGKKGERTKKFAAVRLSPHTSVRFKFLLPDAIFWDDEEYFSGKIENSDTMTKFNERTGIVWKETKDE